MRTFADVATDAERAARFYASRGVRRGDIVVLMGTHSVDLYGAWLGCQWVGAVPTMLAEPSVRVDKKIYWTRLQQLVERTSAALVAAAPGAAPTGIESVGRPIASFAEILGSGGPTPARAKTSDDDVAFLQHSSGTTGLQKGVVITHGALRRHDETYASLIRPSDGDVVASWLPLYHDLGFIGSYLFPMRFGVPVVWLSPFEWVAAPDLLLRAIAEHRATLTSMPNFAFSFLAERAAPPGSYDLASLRMVINCGEVVTDEAMTAFRRRFEQDGLRPDAVCTMYAMAENVLAISATSPNVLPRRRLVARQTWEKEHRSVLTTEDRPLVHVSSGLPLPGVDVRIADDAGKVLPAGVAGRILVRSPYLFSGYFKEEGRADFDGDGFFDTGDVGYLDEEGHVYATGRRKDIVIVAGRNIYPTDVENVVNEVPGVHPGRVVCFGVPIEGAGTEGLVVLAESDESQSAWASVLRAIRSAVVAHLDLDVHDVRIVARNSLHKSTSGKLSRSGNRRSYLAGEFTSGPRTRSTPYVPPSDDVERAVIEVWEGALGVDRIGRDDDLVELGGSSLSAGTIASRLTERVGVPLTVGAVLGAKTPAGLAAAIRGGERLSTRPLVPFPRDPEGDDAAVGPMEEIIAKRERLKPGENYVSIDVWLDGDLVVEAIEPVLQSLARRHEILRTTYVIKPGRVLARIVDPARWRFLESVDLTEKPIEVDAHDPLRGARIGPEPKTDIFAGPVFAAKLFRVAPRRHLLALSVHRIACDARSAHTIVRDFAALYDAWVTKRAPALPALDIQFGDWAAWRKKKIAEQRERVIALLPKAGAAPRSAGTVVRARTSAVRIARTLPAPAVSAIHAAALRARVTPASCFTASLVWMLSGEGKESEVRVGMTIARHALGGLADVVGSFADVAVLRIDVGACRGPADVLRRVEIALRESLDEETPGLAELLHEARAANVSAEAVVPRVILNYRALFDPMDYRFASIAARGAVVRRGAGGLLQSEMTISLDRLGEEFLLRLIYDPARLTEAEATETLARYVDHLAKFPSLLD